MRRLRQPAGPRPAGTDTVTTTLPQPRSARALLLLALALPVAVGPAPAAALLRDPAQERRMGAGPRGEAPALYGEELGLPDTLGVGKVTDDVAGQFPAVEALTDYLTARAAEIRYARALPVLARDHDEAVAFLAGGLLDLLPAEPLEALRDAEASGAEILLGGSRPDRNGSRIVVFVRDDSSARTLADLQEDCFAFGPGESSSAFLLPLAVLRERGLRITRLGGPDGEPPAGHAGYFVLAKGSSAVRAVSRRLVLAGAVTDDEWQREKAGGNTDGLRIVHTSESLPRALVLSGPGMSPERREALQRALLAMNDDPAARPLLEGFGNISAFEPVDDRLRHEIEHMRRLYGLVRDEVR